MLRWMAPFLSFTAEEAWSVFGTSESIFLETFIELGDSQATLLEKWQAIQAVRDVVNKEIETKRSAGELGASLQAELVIQCEGAAYVALAALGADVKFVFITSKVQLTKGPLKVDVKSSTSNKCDRCWHYSEDVGADEAHPTVCGRCISNLFGSGESRLFA
jgi:isoleucyl-tRNA synthetase